MPWLPWYLWQLLMGRLAWCSSLSPAPASFRILSYASTVAAPWSRRNNGLFGQDMLSFYRCLTTRRHVAPLFPRKIGIVLSGASLSSSLKFAAQPPSIHENKIPIECLKYHNVESSTRPPTNEPLNLRRPSWRAKSSIDFASVKVVYRKQLPFVLKDTPFDTHASTSSVQPEVTNAQIKIHGVDMRGIGWSSFLDTAFCSLSLFGATSQGSWHVQPASLQPAWLLPKKMFGAVGKQLLVLVRALKKNSRWIVIEKASSVDVEIDVKYQGNMETPFATHSVWAPLPTTILPLSLTNAKAPNNKSFSDSSMR
ncbi:hypothetical protein BKA70DRAFT_1425571 [Coprinopsis sp. MPI-PUGE-AT-0042]|nr:hypothetical protein BKA70DRAFT_1425571 [Coprinopsis sp. MPI-PUGE-AT-0042]